MTLLTISQAAQRAAMPASSLRGWASRLRNRADDPIELWAPQDQWLDRRTPLVDSDRLDAVLAARPGRGRRWSSPAVDLSPPPTPAHGEEDS